VRLLRHLRALGGIETHLVISPAGAVSLHHELGLKRGEVERLADRAYRPAAIWAEIASGSFATDGMVVAPCSARTLAGVAHGLSDTLIARAADVCLKERRRLVLLLRETPLDLAHIRNMEAVTLMGGIVMPPVPAFYNRPESVEALVDATLARVLDLLGLDGTALAPRWSGLGEGPGPSPAGDAAAMR